MICARKVKMLLNKRQSFIVLKVVVFLFIFGLYFIVLIKESMNIMENNAKAKVSSIGIAKVVDNSQQQQSILTSPNKHHKAHLINKLKINKTSRYHKLAHRKQPSSHHNKVAINNKLIAMAPKSSFNHSSTDLSNNNVESKLTDNHVPAYRKQLEAQQQQPSTTLNPIYEYSEEINAKAEQDFTKRSQHLWEVCERTKVIGKFPPNAWEFFISPGHGLAWCNIFKAASTTWMYFFNILAGYDIKYLQRTIATPLELARKRFPRPSIDDLNEALDNSISFLVVREPFERLLSAYRNKMEDGRNTYYKLLGDQIVKKFRTTPLSKNEPQGPTFREFLEFVIQHYKSGGRFDEHWSPIYQFCTPCSINFTLIAKMETFQRDTEYIIRQAGLETLLLNKMPKQKENKISNRNINHTDLLIPKYFSQIDEELLQQILDIYQLDFDLFQYDSTKYAKMVQKGGKAKSIDNIINNRVDFDVKDKVLNEPKEELQPGTLKVFS